MAALPGFHLTSGWLAQASDHVNIASTDAFDNALYTDSGASSIPVGVSGVPSLVGKAPRTPKVLPGVKVRGFADDWYNRIHVNPKRLDLGNILSTKISTVTVWNAYFTDLSLVDIDGLVDGIFVDGNQPPFDWPALAEHEYEVSVTQDGASRVDTILVWGFDNADTGRLPITADRVFIWAFLPDWEEGITERLEWLTDLLASRSLVEQRRALRIAPRRGFTAEMYVEERERQFLDLALFDWSSRIWGLPVWPEVQLLTQAVSASAMRIPCVTDYLDFYPGGLVILHSGSVFNCEGAVIASVDATGIDLESPLQNTWPAGTRLYPARTAQLRTEPKLKRLTDRAVSAAVEFVVVEPCDWIEALPSTLYRGFPVLEQRPDETEDLTSTQARLIATLDSGSALPLMTDVAGRAMPVRAWKWVGSGRQERASLRSLLYGLRGRQVPIWIPTHADDLTVVSIIVDTATSIEIAHCGYTRFGKQIPGRRDIRIELFDGSVFHRRITGSQELSSAVERLQIDSALGVSVSPSQVSRVCWMSLSRLSSDRVEIEHVTDSAGVATCALTFRGVRDDDI